MRAHSRKLLWLAFWVTGFAVAMACMLLSFKHRAALDALQRDRLERVAGEIEQIVARNLAIGLAFGEIATLPDALDSEKNTEDLVTGIDAIDAQGRVLYSTDRSRVRGDADPAWRAAIARAKDRTWHASDGSQAAVGAVIRNSFGLVLGHVVVRYRLEALDNSNREFARRLAWWGLAIAAGCTLLIFAMLSWVHAVLDRRLVRARAALDSPPPRPARPGSLTGEASATRVALEAANRELDRAEAALAARDGAT